MSVTLVTAYEVAKANVYLTIVIGNAQLGSSAVKLNNKVLGTGDIEELLVGKGPSIEGKPLSVKSVVTDVNDKTNQTSIRYKLKGGKFDKNYDLEATVSQEGESVIYRATFHLKA